FSASNQTASPNYPKRRLPPFEPAKGTGALSQMAKKPMHVRRIIQTTHDSQPHKTTPNFHP
ncbi:hypothetical protein, partial [Vibrio xiamenensis]|uniref:hypothetical protein n=1 Tax=Vibrio xiamenensis TaxID=861298 RepID=UPI001C40AF9A